MHRNYRLLLLGLLVLALNQGFKEYAGEGIEIINKEKEKRVDVIINGQPFTSYIYPTSIKKPVLYPLRTSKGTLVTRGYPLDPRPFERADHPHHVGLWFNHGDVNGLDFWNNSDSISPNKRDKMGTIIHQKVNRIKGGKDKGILEVTSNWVRPDGKVLLIENTQFIFTYTQNTRTIDRIAKLTATDQPVLFQDSKEGLMGLRVARELELPYDVPDIFTDAKGKVVNVPVLNDGGITGQYMTSMGKEGTGAWGTRGKWATLSGKINNEDITIAIIDHPSNTGYPCYWVTRGYGLFGANPLGNKIFTDGKEEFNFKLDAGKSITFHYRVIINSGKEKLNLTPFDEASKK